MLKAIIFDLDNTLVDFLYMKNQAIDAAIIGMKEVGLDIKHSKAKKMIFNIYEKEGYEYQEVLNEFITSIYGEINYKVLAAGIVCYRIAKEKSLVPYPNVNTTLIKISKLGLKLGLITDAASREAWTRLYSANLHHLFDKVITYGDTKNHKPSKVPFIMILNYFDISPSEATMVGDWPERDMEGARNVGMKTAYAKYGDTGENNNSIKAGVILNDISEILEYIKKENNL